MEQVFLGITAAVTPLNLLLIVIGTIVGIIFGAIPGLTAGMAVALFLPITFGMEAISAMCLLVSLYLGGVSGGLISAILLRIPGIPSSLATTFDGYPMAQNGEAGKALASGIIFSFLGGMFSIIVMILIASKLAYVAMYLTSYDYFAIILFSLTLIAGLSGQSMSKGIIAGMLGIFFGMVGADPIDGVSRFTFGISALNGGFVFLPVMVGTFAISQIFKAAEESKRKTNNMRMVSEVTNVRISFKEFKSQLKNFAIASVIGTGIGILPGIGGGTSNLISYSVVKKQSKYPEKFGTGIVDGIVASETANNASVGGAMIPLLALGIPGDAVTAVLIGGLMIHGISPGPLLFVNQGVLVYAIFTALIIANIVMIVSEFSFIKLFSKLLDLPKKYLLPLILGVCVIGAIGANNNVFDVSVMILFGVIAYLMEKFKYPVAPMIMGFVLGSELEVYFRRALIYGNGSLAGFVTSIPSLIILTLTLLSVIFTVRRQRRNRIKN